MLEKRKALQRLEDRCRNVEHRCEDIERAFKGLQLEWEELYDKVRHQMSRMSKRVPAAPEPGPNGLDPETPTETASGLDPVSDGILRRRAGLSGRPT